MPFPCLANLNGKEETLMLVSSRQIVTCYSFMSDWNYKKENQPETGTLPLEAKLKEKLGVQTRIDLISLATIYSIFY